MFTVGPSLPVEGVEPGSTLLVVGPPMTGKRNLVMDLLAQGVDSEGIAVVSTDASATDTRESVAERAGRPVDDIPLGTVDCVGDSHGTDGLGPLDSRVSSPADLTGIGMELTTLLERLYVEHAEGLRVGLLSLTTMSMYASPEQVVRFLHAFRSRISDANAFGLVVAHSDTMDDEYLQRLRSFVDSVVEMRETDGTTELRVLGGPGGSTAWTGYERTQKRVAEASGPATDDVAPTASLRELFDGVRTDAPTLTVLNHGGSDEEFAAVERYFDRQGVAVRTASLDTAEPSSIAVLHHGDNLLGSETMTALRGAVDIELAADGEFGERETSDLLTQLDRSVFGAAAADRSLLIDVSHTIELLANRTGSGRIHAGFQRLSNLVDDEQAARIYGRLSDSGVDVHVYGTPDAETELPGVTVHEDEGEEIAESWFVVYDGGGDPDRQAALLAIEREGDGTFEGFWTYDGDSDIPRRLDAYLTDTYHAGSVIEGKNTT